MKVCTAKSAGFCFGVERAVSKVYEQAEKGRKPIYTSGPIIHNEEVVKDLEEKGVRVLKDEEELRSLREGTVIIRSHGVGRHIYQLIEAQGLSCVDATCPYVRKIHRIVEEESAKGRHIIIIGSARHPEVEGIMGYSSTPVTVIASTQEAEQFQGERNACFSVVSQTTFNYNKFQELVEIILKKGYDIVVLNTICNATEERQAEAREIAARSDAMIVIGGRHSSNTQKLFEICKKECNNTYYIQTLVDLDISQLQSTDYVGITAGASTPKKIIEEVRKGICQK